MPDYTQGKIYKIVKKDEPNLCYVGSTIQGLIKRLSKHKSKSKQEAHRILYEKIDGKWDEWEMVLIENYPCNSKKELLQREGELIRELGTLNIHIEGRTKKEYYQENKGEFKIKMKTYRDKNRDEINRNRREARALKKAGKV